MLLRRFFRKQDKQDTQDREGEPSHPAGPDGELGDGSSELCRLEARRLTREATSDMRWPGRRDASDTARALAKGAAAYRLAPELEGAIGLYAQSLEAAGRRGELHVFLGENWKRAEAGHRRELLSAWLAGMLEDPHDDGALRSLAQWAKEGPADPASRALGLVLLGKQLVEQQPDFHPLQLFPMIVKGAFWDAETILGGAVPALSANKGISPPDRAYLWYHVFRVTGSGNIGGDLALLASAVGAVDLAVAIREALGSRDPGSHEQPALAAEALVAAGRYKRAAEFAAVASERKPSSIFSLYLRVRALRLQKREQEAAPLIEAMRDEYARLEKAHDPELTKNLLWFYGNFLPDEGRLTELAARARREQVEDTYVERARGALLYRTGRNEAAAEVLAGVFEKNPDDHDVAALLARALLHLRRKVEARSMLDRALESDPGSTHRAELESLIREAEGQPPPLPESFVQARDFLTRQRWDFLEWIPGAAAWLELSIGPLTCGEEPLEPTKVTVKIRNKGKSHLPLSPRGPVGDRLYLYGVGRAAKGQMVFSDLTNRKLDPFIALEPGGEIEVELDLGCDLQSRLFFQKAVTRPLSGWIVAAIVPKDFLARFDAAFMKVAMEKAVDRPSGIPLDPEVTRSVALSPVTAFSFAPRRELPAELEHIHEGLDADRPTAAWEALHRLQVVLEEEKEHLDTAWRRGVEGRLQSHLFHSEPVIRVNAALILARSFPDTRREALSAAAADAHWYVRLASLLAADRAELRRGDSRLADLAGDPDDTVRRAAAAILWRDDPH